MKHSNVKNYFEILITVVFSILALIFLQQTVVAQSRPPMPPKAGPWLWTKIGKGAAMQPSRRPSGAASHKKASTTQYDVTAVADSVPSPDATDPVGLTVTKTWDSDSNSWQIKLDWDCSTCGETPSCTVSYSSDPSFQIHDKTLSMNNTNLSYSALEDSSQNLECFDVTDGSVTSRPVQGIGYDPYPAPSYPTIVNDGKWWGDNVSLSGSYMDTIAEGNLLGFFDLGVKAHDRVDGGDGFATQATFMVPEDGRGAFPLIQSHGKTPDIPNGTKPFIHLYPKNIPQFTTIRDIVYAPQTGHVWVAADSVVEEIDIFTDDPGNNIKRTLTSYTKPYISRVTTDGRLLIVDGVSGGSEIDQIDVTDPDSVPSCYAYITDTEHTPNFTRSILPVGIAVSPDGSAGYIADTIYGSGHGRVIRFPEGNSQAITDEYGGFIMWIFPDPCGIDVGLTGFVYVSNTGGWFIPWIGIITDANNSAEFEYINDIAYSIEVDRDVSTSSFDRFYVSTQPETMAYNKNEIPIPGGGTYPARYHGADIVADSGFLSVEPMWEYLPLHHYNQRVILNNENHDFPYDSIYQGADRIVKLEIPGWSGVKLHLRLIDPPDYSAYAPTNGWSAKGTETAVPPYEAYDNEVWDTAYTDFGLTTYSNGDLVGTPPIRQLVVTPGDDNIATAYLKLPENYSGDNWQVEVEKEDTSNNIIPNEVPAFSAVYTGWKRVFIEKDKMFRRGGIVYAPNVASSIIPSNTSVLQIYKGPSGSTIDNLNVGDKIAIFDENSPFEGKHDEAYVGSIDRTSDVHYAAITLVTERNGSTPYYTNYTYIASPLDSATHYPDFYYGSSAAVGVIDSTYSINGETITDTSDNQINGTGSAFFDADMRDIEQTYDDAYVQFIALRDGAGAVPYLPKAWFDTVFVFPYASLAEFSQIWFKNFQSSGAPSPPYNDPHNYFHLLGSSALSPDSESYTLGITEASYDFSFILVDSIDTFGTDNSASEQQIKYINQDTTNHELGHQFHVNACSSGHDSRSAWCDGSGHCNLGGSTSQDCLMNSGLSQPISQTEDGVSRFCAEDLFTGDPNCTDTPRSGAIRTDNDPQ